MLSSGGTPLGPGSAMANFAALQFASNNGIPMMMGPGGVMLPGANNQMLAQFGNMMAAQQQQHQQQQQQQQQNPQQQQQQQNQIASALAASHARMGSNQPSPAQLQLLSIQQAATQRIQAQLAQQAMSQVNAMQANQGQMMQMLQMQQQQMAAAMAAPQNDAAGAAAAALGAAATSPDSEPALIHTAGPGVGGAEGLTPPNGLPSVAAAPVTAS